MLVKLRTPITGPENSVTIRNLLWLPRPLIIFTAQTCIHINTFPTTFTPQMAKNHAVSMHFSTNAIIALCHAPP